MLHSGGDVTRPRLLDTYCKAGGTTRGYQLAGFYVVGVDIEDQPNYCGDEFVQMDALEYLAGDLSSFDAVAASPPCQFASSATRVSGTPSDHQNLIPPTRELLIASGLPYVIENVEGARDHLISPVKLCGSMFDPPLDVQRHRYFETNWPLRDPDWPCRHNLWDFRFRSLDQRRRKGLNQRSVPVHGGAQLARVVGVHGALNYANEGDLRKQAMEIDWMTQAELTQAIPPRYCEFIGHQLAQYLSSGVVAPPPEHP